MARVKIQGAEHPIKDIFSDQFVFEIPPYQRPYSWTTEQAGELFEDLLGGLRESDETDRDPYFLGSIVLAKEERSPSAKVIDGQQRLTTLTILLAAMAVGAKDDEKRELREFILQQGSKLKQTATVYRVTLRPRDAKFFQKYVQASDGFQELLLLDPGPLSDAQRNIQANARLFVERLAELQEQERSDFGTYLCFGSAELGQTARDRV